MLQKIRFEALILSNLLIFYNFLKSLFPGLGLQKVAIMSNVEWPPSSLFHVSLSVSSEKSFFVFNKVSLNLYFFPFSSPCACCPTFCLHLFYFCPSIFLFLPRFFQSSLLLYLTLSHQFIHLFLCLHFVKFLQASLILLLLFLILLSLSSVLVYLSFTSFFYQLKNFFLSI